MNTKDNLDNLLAVDSKPFSATETIVAPATPPAESALAVLRVSGPLAEELAVCAFSLKTPPAARRATVGFWRDVTGAPLDQCVFTFYAAGASYTGEPSLEITCHGNPLVVRKILRDCTERGCRLAGPGEFTRRAFLNGRLDLAQAEAVAQIIAANSDDALASARRLLAGELGKKVADWAERLLQTLAELEAYIDFPEEDLPAADTGGPAASLKTLATEFARTAASARYSAALRDGIKLVLAGAPNAGKSSLLNALLGEERALVSPEPGTTRDFIREQLSIGAHRVLAVDTAGLRLAGDAAGTTGDAAGTENAVRETEKRGMERSREQVAGADFCLVVVDASAPPPALPADVLETIASLAPERAMLALNKSDLPADAGTVAFLPALPRVALSAKTGAGLDALRTALASAFERGGIAPAAGELVVNERHAGALRTAGERLAAAAALLADTQPTELAAAEIRAALDALAEITGRDAVANERLLDHLFASFCIGK